MTDVIDQQFEQYRRMAEQQHPEVLPVCVQTLHSAMDSALQKIAALEAPAAKSLYKRIGITATITAVALYDVLPFGQVTHNQNLAIITAGTGFVVMVGQAAFDSAKKMRDQSSRYELMSEYFQVRDLYDSAHERAVEMGVVTPPTQEGQI